MAIVAIEHEGPLVLDDIVFVVDVQRIGELRLQAGVSLRDVERVGVVGDVEQLRDVGLTGVTAVVQPDVVLVAELQMEVERRGEVRHVAHSVNIASTIVLNEVRVLGLYEDAHVVVVLLLPVAQRQSGVVGVVLILGIAAERAVEEIVEVAVNGCEPVVPLPVDGHDALEDVRRLVAEVVGLAVALVLAVAQLVVGLQVGTLPEGLAVGGAQHVAAVVRRRGVVAGGEEGGVLTGLVLHAVEVHLVVRDVALLVVTSVAF